MTAPRILVVDDEHLIRWALREKLQGEGYDVVEAEDGQSALDRCDETTDLVLLDLRLPDMEGTQVLRGIRERFPETLVILMTAFSSIPSAVEAIKLGAYHYVNKPLDLDAMALLIGKALENTGLRRELRALRASQSEPYGFERIVGESQAMRSAKALLKKIAGSRASTVLLTGESGTGKDLAAKAVHYGSRASGPFQNITCSALPEALLESELFGHERGAFTDAKLQKKGLLEQADGGTVFLDEIGEMAPSLQAKLLRFLEEKAFRRVGGSVDIRVDVRIVAATNRNLEDAVKEGRFREDLYYRLRVLPVVLPPLREREGDIPLLATHFVEAFVREFKKSIRGISPDAMALLERSRWPGNVRELRNAVERAVILCDSDTLGPEDFPGLVTGGVILAGFVLPPEGLDLDQLERDLVLQALRRTGANQTQAGKLLGLNRDQVRYRIEKFGLDLAALPEPSAARAR